MDAYIGWSYGRTVDIVDSICISGIYFPIHEPTLSKFGITSILSIFGSAFWRSYATDQDILWLRKIPPAIIGTRLDLAKLESHECIRHKRHMLVKAEDNVQQNLLQYFESTSDWIEEQLSTPVVTTREDADRREYIDGFYAPIEKKWDRIQATTYHNEAYEGAYEVHPYEARALGHESALMHWNQRQIQEDAATWSDWQTAFLTGQKTDHVAALAESRAATIDVQERKNVVLVHCRGGHSRSAAIKMAYLMRKHSWSLEKVSDLLFLKRSSYPNASFLEQLKAWEEMQYDIFESPGVYKAQYRELKDRLEDPSSQDVLKKLDRDLDKLMSLKYKEKLRRGELEASNTRKG